MPSFATITVEGPSTLRRLKICCWHWSLMTMGIVALSPLAVRALAQDSAVAPPSVSLLDEAITRLSRLPSVTANVRQRIDLYGRRLIGFGSYRQMRTRTDLLFRFELKVPVGDTLASLLQVSDGRYLWTYRVLPDKQIEKGLDASLSTVDLNRVRELIYDPRQPPTDFGMGGLPGLLEQTARMFEFRQAAQKSGLHGTSVWVLDGEIRRSLVEQMTIPTDSDGAGEESRSDALNHIPDRVSRQHLASMTFFPTRSNFDMRIARTVVRRYSFHTTTRGRW